MRAQIGKNRVQLTGLFLGPLLAVLILLLPEPEGLSWQGWSMVALLILMVIWWVTEAIPLPVTAMLPLIFVPLSGLSSFKQAAIPYASPIILLLVGGFIIAKSIERWNLHARLALYVISLVGFRPSALVAGFMLASALLSMWISNTSTTLMLLPIAASVALSLTGGGKAGRPLTVAILLGVAYAASVGGLATPVGTPTNLIVISYLEGQWDMRLSFAQWMMIGLPAVMLVLPAIWWVLRRHAHHAQLLGEQEKARQVITEQKQALGPWTSPEIRVALLFAVIAFCWMFRRYILNDLSLFGLTPLAGLTDPMIAIAGAVAMFLIPSGSRKEPGSMLLDWETANQIPWGIAILFGGGLSLAAAMTSSGLAAWLGAELSFLTSLPLLLILFLLIFFVIFTTEVTSNVATATALMPVIGAIALGGGADPLLLAIPVALAASCAFMLPMATGPNAIVFATGDVKIGEMMRLGLLINLLACLLITALVYWLVPIIFGSGL